ncbi:hypothetical protein BCV32_06175 [Vibrio sp. 10N.286.55.C11]|nr:hypothetical protein BCV32_06175 [Vibrio sp. 10N.286.55.C11]
MLNRFSIKAERIQQNLKSDFNHPFEWIERHLSLISLSLFNFPLLTNQTELTTRSKTILVIRIGFAEFFYTEC